ncbi:MAG: hypothetical protein LQ351_007230 [Letrouitia transgressa]|nr:MAG: hypothetical protein LQ351_007230 [Letrouitia transgressa]
MALSAGLSYDLAPPSISSPPVIRNGAFLRYCHGQASAPCPSVPVVETYDSPAAQVTPTSLPNPLLAPMSFANPQQPPTFTSIYIAPSVSRSGLTTASSAHTSDHTLQISNPSPSLLPSDGTEPALSASNTLPLTPILMDPMMLGNPTPPGAKLAIPVIIGLAIASLLGVTTISLLTFLLILKVKLHRAIEHQLAQGPRREAVPPFAGTEEQRSALVEGRFLTGFRKRVHERAFRMSGWL